jgi:hypothetical protein
MGQLHMGQLHDEMEADLTPAGDSPATPRFYLLTVRAPLRSTSCAHRPRWGRK